MGIENIRKLKGLENLYPKRLAVEREVNVKPPKPAKKIPMRSAKQTSVMAELKKLYPLFLAKHKICEISGPECTRIASCIHHTEGRLPSKVMDSTKWVASCAPCNLWVEVHHADAAKKGFKKSKFK